ncbi:hypothetical protein GUJ93_ZPchr0100g33248 [Zizania palustris]|uniref:Poly(A) RNA polymerase mitochondrial-like central palm domain-containing protein n=1 Tax=Zizania palustris TaxID=103762 RepID=A0A8J5RKA0_ZIZPA|nr:hypothetical protein GUJ93_ZPchr0100g33248 [Zizania palustris]
MAAAAAAVPPVPSETDTSSRPEHSSRPPSLAISWDSQALCKHAENCELESAAFLINPTFIPILEGLLLEIYAMLRPNPDDYKKRHIMLDVFNKIAEDIFGKKNGFPVVEAFGSFTMDLFTPRVTLISLKLAKVLQSHQRNGRCHGVLPVVTARVPVLKAIDKGTGVECDISVENKDGMSRSMIFKFISSIDERFQIICYLMKFWAKAQGVNCPKDRTMSSMVIISLVAFHLQTRCPPILPAFSVYGSDVESIQRNALLFEGFGCRNKESVAELFVSLMSKLLSVERLWEQGLCASNFEGSWISKAWERGVGNLSVEDFLDRSQNFARSVGKVEMQKICECIRCIRMTQATASTRNCNICNAGDSSHCRKRDAFHHSLVLPDTMAITRQGKVPRSQGALFQERDCMRFWFCDWNHLDLFSVLQMYGVHQKISFSSCKLQPALLLSLSNRQHGR